MKIVRASLLFICLFGLFAARVEGGHEIPFSPSFYPHEISVEVMPAAAAAARLGKSTIQGYVGPDPFAAGAVPAHVTYAESLESYVVLTFGSATGALAEATGRCAAAARTARALGAAKTDVVVHPYPVTPFHGDYLQHVDQAGAVRKRVADASGHDPKIRAVGRRLTDALAAAKVKATDGEAEATLEEIPVDRLLAPAETRLDGWLGPPWIKDGWFQTYLLQRDHVGDAAARRALDDAVRQRQAGDDLVGRVNLERRLVALATRDCHRVTVGYTLRREALSAEYSDGIENIAYDAQAGIASPIFVRTAKLKDFPWNGVLRLGAERRATAAWNPVSGFGDATGRLLWAAVGDPALLPAPSGAGWIANRVRPLPEGTSPGAVEAPADALVPDPLNAGLRPAGRPTLAAARIVYRVRASAFHDGLKMSPADLLYPYALAFRWGTPAATASSGARATPARHDPEIARATALLRESVAAVKVVRVDKEIQDFGEVQLVYDVPEIHVYLRSAVDPAFAAAVAPPWSAVPWQVLALMEEAAARGIGAFSEAEAKRRGVSWLDLVRDRKVRDGLSALVAGFERRAFVPDALRGVVTVDQARERWAALRRFHAKHGHFLVTNGPYRLDRWSAEAVTLGVFRDLTYPVGVGAYDDQALPLRAFVRRAERAGDRLEIEADVETLVKGGRSYKIEREPFRPAPAGEKMPDTLVARYVVLGPGDDVVAAGTSRQRDGARLIVDLKGRLKPGAYRVLLALELNGNSMKPEVKVIAYRVAD
ncbi:MAG TPA: hypothetical protein VG389_04575 [Myxococcota bacterium]|nr:hypothetical protein [Myxococcota bacterium]